jgi:hypothetical protein
MSTMTLEQVRDAIRARPYVEDSIMLAWADAIDAHLAGQGGCVMDADVEKAVELDPQPLVTGPTKWRAEHCVSHHYACHCREWEHACELEKWQGIAELSHGEMAERLERAETLLRDIKAWDVGSFQSRKTLFSLPLYIRARITAHLGGEQ